MVELVSVACMSVACKLDEVTIPSLHDLQVRTYVHYWIRSIALYSITSSV